MRKKFVYLPQATSDHDRTSKPDAILHPKGTFPCPCCGYLTLPVPQNAAIAHICPVCFWENDVFLTSDHEPSDENHGMTLREGRENDLAFGACAENMLAHVRKPEPEEFPK